MYLDTNMPSFPNSKELFGYWVGVAENVGDALTYLVLTPDYQVIARSALCPAYHPEHQNLCQAEGESAENLRPPTAGTTIEEINENATAFLMPTIDPNNIVGFQFIKEHNEFPLKAKVLESLDNGSKYLVALGDGDQEEILTYNEIMELVNNELDKE